jgi:hypothetical protein
MELRFKVISEATPPNPKAHHPSLTRGRLDTEKHGGGTETTKALLHHGTTEDTEDSAKHSNNISTAIFLMWWGDNLQFIRELEVLR